MNNVATFGIQARAFSCSSWTDKKDSPCIPLKKKINKKNTPPSPPGVGRGCVLFFFKYIKSNNNNNNGTSARDAVILSVRLWGPGLPWPLTLGWSRVWQRETRPSSANRWQYFTEYAAATPEEPLHLWVWIKRTGFFWELVRYLSSLPAPPLYLSLSLFLLFIPLFSGASALRCALSEDRGTSCSVDKVISRHPRSVYLSKLRYLLRRFLPD